jgi:serine/threonine protein kinase
MEVHIIVVSAYDVAYNDLFISFSFCSNASDFLLDSQLGEGSYGQTFRAHNVTSGEAYAIKLYRLHNTERVKMLREIFIVQSLCGHRNIIKLPYIVQQSLTGYPALVFEFIEAIDLYKLLTSITPEETRFYAHELISGVAYAHERGVVHKDLKPANVLIHHATRTLKIIDWGLSLHHVPGAGCFAYPPDLVS